MMCNDFRKRAWRTELMQWRKHVRIKYGGRVGVGQGQRERDQVQLQVRVVQLHREGGARLSYVCHQPQLSSTARRSCSAATMLCCGRRKVSATYGNGRMHDWYASYNSSLLHLSHLANSISCGVSRETHRMHKSDLTIYFFNFSTHTHTHTQELHLS